MFLNVNGGADVTIAASSVCCAASRSMTPSTSSAYAGSNFLSQDDGHGGTLISYQAHLPHAQV